MKKNLFFVIILVMICSLGYSQTGKYPIKVYIGKTLCKDTMSISRTQLINEGKITVIANGTETISKISYSMQITRGNNLSEKVMVSDFNFPLQMKDYIKYDGANLIAKKLWIENIKVEYKGETIILNSIAINIKD